MDDVVVLGVEGNRTHHRAEDLLAHDLHVGRGVGEHGRLDEVAAVAHPATGWIALNALAVSLRWDPYPFILLNLAFSTQAAYVASLILLAQTRQADRDKAAADHIATIADAQRRHVEQQSGGLRDLVAANTALTQQIAAMTSEIHATACGQGMPQLSDDATLLPPHPPAGAA
jgi:Protein of unknown function (DUF1003)